MHRLAIALMAIASLIMNHPGEVFAQNGGRAVDPAKGVHKIDEPVSKSQSTAVPSADKKDTQDSQDITDISADQSPQKQNGETVVVPQGKTVDSIDVKGKNLIISGHVTKNVHAVDSTVTIECGARVDGVVETQNCLVTNNGSGINMVVIGKGNKMEESGSESGLTNLQKTAVTAPRVRPVPRRHDWFRAQLALTFLGLLGAILSMVVTPNASRRVAEHLAAQPRRDFMVGSIIGVAALVLLVADAILLKLPLIKLLWAPFGILIAFVPLILLAFGWLAGMCCAGDFLARKLNRPTDGSTFSRMVLGLAGFFVLNVVLGGINHGLGVMGLCVEIGLAVMGVGAATVIASGNGFGRKA